METFGYTEKGDKQRLKRKYNALPNKERAIARGFYWVSNAYLALILISFLLTLTCTEYLFSYWTCLTATTLLFALIMELALFLSQRFVGPKTRVKEIISLRMCLRPLGFTLMRLIPAINLGIYIIVTTQGQGS